MVGSGRLGIWFSLSVVLSCGGQSQRRNDDDASGGGSSGASFGGTSGATAAGGTIAGDCVYDGQIYPVGSSFAASDGCNTCTCSSEGVGCTLLECPTGCTIEGRAYAHGEVFTFNEPNGCGTCTCNDGEVMCATTPCPGSPRCDMLSFWYSERAFFAGRGCDPAVDLVQCTVAMPSALPCGCPTFVNEDAMLRSWLMEWQMLACGNDILCEPCPMPPVRGVCSADGVCIDAY
jgi:hypothetical protein